MGAPSPQWSPYAGAPQPAPGSPAGWAGPPAEPASWKPVVPQRRTVPIVAIVLVGILVGAVLAYAIVRGAAGSTPTVVAAPHPGTVAPDVTPGPTASDPAAGGAVDPSTLGVDGPRFATPSHNIACRMDQADSSARCDVVTRTWQVPPQPSSCASAWGQGAQVVGPDVGTLTCASDTVADPSATVLQYGESVTYGGIVCVSSNTGVRCTDTGTQHGFRVSRASYDLF